MKCLLVASSALGFEAQGWNNNYHGNWHHDDRLTWVLYNDGQVWHSNHWGAAFHGDRDRWEGWWKQGNYDNQVTDGFSGAVWNMKPKEYVDVTSQHLTDTGAFHASWEEWNNHLTFKYDTRYAKVTSASHRGGEDWASAARNGDLVASVTSLETVRGNGGRYNRATNNGGETNSRADNYGRSWHDESWGQSFEDCSVVGLFHRDHDQNNEWGDMGSAQALVLYGHGNLNWNSDARALCRASQLTNKYLAHRYEDWYGRYSYPEENKLSGGCIAGITSIVIASVILLFLFLYCCCVRGRGDADQSSDI